MIKNITIGQYFKGNSPIHRLDPRTKLILMITFVVMLFMASGINELLLCLVFVIFLYLIARVPIKMILKSIKPILPIVLFTSVLNMFFVTGHTLVSFWVISISAEGLMFAIIMCLRLVTLITGTSLLTYTTSPIALTDGMEGLMTPLSKLKFPSHEFAMMMTIALRFIPTLVEETDKIMNAQKARGADLETGGLIKKIKALVPILIPLFISAFRRADELAMAMESRCYQGGEGRTRMKKLQFSYMDIIGTLVLSGVFAGVILSARFIPALVIK